MVELLEAELAQFKQLIAKLLKKETPWWIKVAGSLEDDPDFDEALRLGKAWRKAAE